MKAERVPPITPRCRPRQSPAAAGTAGDEPAHIWCGLIACLIHPTKVAIVEALLWVGEPLSATELTRLLGDPALYLAHVSNHASRLVKQGVLEVVARRRAEAASTIESFYYFAAEEAA